VHSALVDSSFYAIQMALPLMYYGVQGRWIQNLKGEWFSQDPVHSSGSHIQKAAEASCSSPSQSKPSHACSSQGGWFRDSQGRWISRDSGSPKSNHSPNGVEAYCRSDYHLQASQRLWSNLTYGVEIECFAKPKADGVLSEVSQKLRADGKLRVGMLPEGEDEFHCVQPDSDEEILLDKRSEEIHNWTKVMEDGSIKPPLAADGICDKEGVEIATQILRFDQESAKTLETICSTLDKAGVAFNESTGLHIHVGCGQHFFF